MDETGLENELLSDNTEALPSEVVPYSGDRTYDPGPNTGQYGYVEVEQDGEVLQCTNAYMSSAYGGQYCVGDSYTDPNGGTQVIREIGMTGLDLAPAQWNTEETYADVGEKLGMSMEEWTEFSAEIQALNETVDGLKGNMFGPTDQERGRLGIRISNENPDWTEEQVMAEADRLLEEKWQTSDAYREAALAETALFEKYGITKPNPGVYGSGIWIDEEGKYHKFESTTGNLYQTSQDTSFLDVAVPVGIGVIAGIVMAPLGGTLTGALTNAGLSPALASAASSSIMNMATQMVTTGDVDISQALLSAAGSYFQEAGMGNLLGDSQVGQALTDATSFVQDKVTSFQDLISTGSSIADAAIQAGGMNMLTSLVSSGEVDLQSALISAVSAGASTAIQNSSIQDILEAGGITSEDEFEAFLSEDDELQQAFIDADVKDPFLNPNYVTIGDGLMQNEAGEVFNYDGDSVGNMSDLDVDGDGVLNANDLEFVETTGEYRAIPQDVQDALNPIDETPALQLQDGNTYYLDAEGNVYTRDQVEWRGGDTNDFVVIGTDTVAGTTATYSQGSDVFYDDDMKIVLRGEDAGIINVGTGNEFTYGEQYSGNQIFDDPTGIPADLGAAQYSGTVRGAPGDPGAEFDVYYNPETNTTYLVNQADPTQVNKIEDTTPEEVQEQTPDDPSDPVDNPDDSLTGGQSGVGNDGSPNENEYVEDTNVNDSTVVDVTNPLINNNSTDDNTSSENPNDSTDSANENQEETQEETEEVTDTGEVVDSNGEVTTNTGATANQGNRANQVLGLLQNAMTAASGQNGDTTSTGTEDNTETDGTGDVTDETTIGDNTPGDGGDNSTATGPGDDTTGTGDPGIDDGTGGNGPGGGGSGGGLLAGGGNFTPKWGELFKYTDITPAQAKKMAPMYDYIKQTKGMLS